MFFNVVDDAKYRKETQEEMTALEEHSAGLKQHKKTVSGPLT